MLQVRADDKRPSGKAKVLEVERAKPEASQIREDEGAPTQNDQPLPGAATIERVSIRGRSRALVVVVILLLALVAVAVGLSVAGVIRL